ncbi:uncharacterized protein BJX67DRAFT_142369 [Aspergillus lucknowensis]|uniref:Uncharacterized protein n=1 Tax=Aspergillus lucknowensis TaxID=176173 RepID=A0ABR4LNX0_9EURO
MLLTAPTILPDTRTEADSQSHPDASTHHDQQVLQHRIVKLNRSIVMSLVVNSTDKLSPIQQLNQPVSNKIHVLRTSANPGTQTREGVSRLPCFPSAPAWRQSCAEFVDFQVGAPFVGVSHRAFPHGVVPGLDQDDNHLCMKTAGLHFPVFIH